MVDGGANELDVVVEVAVDGGGGDPSSPGDGTQRDRLDLPVGADQVGCRDEEIDA